MERIGPVIEYEHQGYGQIQYVRVHTSYLCPRSDCLCPSLAFFALVRSRDGIHVSDGPRFMPRGQPMPMEGLPDDIQSDRREACSCFYGGDYRAAVIMARAAIQRAVRVMGAESAGLKAEINDLAQRRVLTQSLQEWAHEVRIAGDDAAHPEDLGAITQDEAEESLRFMEEFLKHGIAVPAAREARKRARQQASDSAGEGPDRRSS
jgi:hypothetical protein